MMIGVVFCYTFLTQNPTETSITIVTPEDNIEEAIKELQPGDTLILQDGVYRQTMKLRGIHGTEEQPITIKAENDGRAIIDGELKRRAIYIEDASYIHLEGLFARDGWSKWETNVVLINQAHHLRLGRITAYKSETIDSHSYPFRILEGSHHILLEDSAGYGTARKIFVAHQNTHHIVVRRFFSRWDGFDRSVNPNPKLSITAVSFYGGERVGYDNVFENVITFLGENPNLPATSVSAGGGDRHKILGSVSLNSNDNPFYFKGCSYCEFRDNVAIKPRGSNGFTAMWSRAPYYGPTENSIVSNFTWVSHEPESRGIRLGNTVANQDSLDIRNSFFQGTASSEFIGLGGSDSQGSLTHAYNQLYGFDAANVYNNYHLAKREEYQDKTAEQIMAEHQETLLTEDPFSSLLPRYGNGAYLMASRSELADRGENGARVGAEVLYQYESNWDPADEEAPVMTTLTDKPLWPWPMEERICAETAQIGDGVNGTSVTYEAHTIDYDYDGDGQAETYHCSGGLWKILDGVYEDEPLSVDPNEQPGATSEPGPTPTETPTPVPTETSTPIPSPEPSPEPESQLTPPVTAMEPLIINLTAGESITFNCDGKKLVLERNNKTQVVGVCRVRKN